jgi:hypothetical protein
MTSRTDATVQALSGSVNAGSRGLDACWPASKMRAPRAFAARGRARAVRAASSVGEPRSPRRVLRSRRPRGAGGVSDGPASAWAGTCCGCSSVGGAHVESHLLVARTRDRSRCGDQKVRLERRTARTTGRVFLSAAFAASLGERRAHPVVALRNRRWGRAGPGHVGVAGMAVVVGAHHGRLPPGLTSWAPATTPRRPWPCSSAAPILGS